MANNTSGNEKKHTNPDPLEYPAQDDIYNQQDRLRIDGQGDILDEDDLKTGEVEDNPGADLDVPGAELDDANEMLGEEDEENNYYSLSDNADEPEDE